MKFLISVFLLLAILSNNYATAADAYVNGKWFESGQFVSRTVYVVDGHIRFTAPDSIDNTYDLSGRFVIPPFAEAHNHDLTSDFNPQERIDEYLSDGVFYAKMQSAFSEGFEKLSPHFNTPESLDVIFAFAPITGPGGHPIRIRELFFDRGYYDEFFSTKEEMSGIGYTQVNGTQDLESKFTGLVGQKPDFIKVMLSHSEEYALRRDDPEFFGYKGVDPELMPRLVQLARENGLRITAHIDTAADFHYAVAAGVDEIAHLPGSRAIEVIRLSDAEIAAKKDIAVVTTASLTTKIRDKYPAYYEEVMGQHARNLQRLKDAGVRILIGSDMPYRDTSVHEAFVLSEMGVFTNVEILTMWCETTARGIFPMRKIGRIDDGFEASFLVLNGDPIEDLSQVKEIELRVKNGQRLSQY
ncbi:MAG: amidohydrolase family protein [Gammaproteobacteria bacterium]|nr:amidohydrolase family protein [Gammaproteobacteria bacterium]